MGLMIPEKNGREGSGGTFETAEGKKRRRQDHSFGELQWDERGRKKGESGSR